MRHRLRSCRPWALLLAGAFALLTLVSPGALEGAATAAPIVKAVVRAKNVRAGDLFNVEIRGRRMKGVSTVAFHLVYDPALVAPVPSGFTEGALLRRGGGTTSFLTRAASTADRVILGVARLGPQGATKGKGLLCRLTFRALSEGTGSLAFDQAQVTDTSARPVAATFRPSSLTVLPARGGAGN